MQFKMVKKQNNGRLRTRVQCRNFERHLIEIVAEYYGTTFN